MGRELRLGFAMGGGVSLGAFSGAALTEAMKLAILRATYIVDDPADPRHGQRVPYDRVVIDVFSGASAGALSLVLMLRSLAEPNPAPNVEDKLRKQFEGEYERLDAPRRAQLIAAQHAQDLQHQAWVREVDLETLLGRKGGKRRDLRHVPSLLDRGAVDEIAARLLAFDKTPDFAGRQILGERVLFATTLSNLTAVQYDARKAREADDAGLIALRDALTSRGHREVRVFDLYFREAPEDLDKGRWFRYHAAAKREEVIGDLRLPKAWARLGATCIACGAFPFAFEPVVLKRKRYEYGDKIWPRQFAHRVEGNEILMTYVDGGTFNNEPIREAFRLASFMDAQSSTMPFDRRIIFVDPRLGPETISFQVPVHTEYRVTDPEWLRSIRDHRLQRLTSLERLQTKAGHIASAVLGEATAEEANKVMSVRDRFKLRDRARELLAPSLNAAPTGKELQALINECKALLESNEENAEFPPVPHNLPEELERIIAEEPAELGVLKGQAESFTNDAAAAENKPLWLRALVYSYIDLLMDLEGKHEDSRVVAIAPIVERTPGNLVYEPLPGHEAKGFAGFTSRASREFQVEMARYSTELLMHWHKLIERPKGHDTPLPTFEDREEFERDYEKGMKLLLERIREVIAGSHLPGPVRMGVRLWLWSWLKFSPESLTRLTPPRRTVEFRIDVPGNQYELDGRAFTDRDRRPVEIDGKHVLITCIDWHPDPASPAGGRWRGPNVEEATQTLRIDEQRSLLRGGDRLFCRIQLPTGEQVARIDDLPYPRFLIEVRESAKDTTLPATKWRVGPPPMSLEERLLAVDPRAANSSIG